MIHAPCNMPNAKVLAMGVVGFGVFLGTPEALAAIDEGAEGAANRLVFRTAPGVEVMIDADGGPWFLPTDGMLQEGMLLDSHRIREAIWTAQTVSIGPIFPGAQFDTRAREHRLDRYHVVEFATAQAMQDAAIVLQASGIDQRIIERIEIDPVGSVASVPNDDWFAEQYGLRNIGQSVAGQPGTPGADIGIVDAWSWSVGSPEITVAVLDSGVNAHEEFSARMLPGWNVPDQDDNVTDQCASHGTKVTGILAAEGDNGEGVAGVAWAVKILPVVVLTGCTGNESWCAEGIYWATQNGADLINYSLQYATGGSAFQDAVAYAHSMGVIQVAATGNTGNSNDVQAPARFSETIAVANIDNRDQRQSSSSQGPEVDLAAAGWQVVTCVGTNSFGYGNGTSMSSPHVAGIAAIMRSLAPDLSPADAKAILIDTSTDIAATGFDEQTGHGRPNAWAAIQALGVDPPAPGDLNRDGEVDGLDFGLMLAAWGSCGDCEEAPCPADLNGDCIVNGIDIGLLLVDWTT